MSEELYKSSTGILNIAVAPDGIFKFVYPFEENKNSLSTITCPDGGNIRFKVTRKEEEKK